MSEMDEQTRGQLIETAARALYEADALGDDLWHLAESQVRGWYEQMAAAVIDALLIERTNRERLNEALHPYCGWHMEDELDDIIESAGLFSFGVLVYSPNE